MRNKAKRRLFTNEKNKNEAFGGRKRVFCICQDGVYNVRRNAGAERQASEHLQASAPPLGGAAWGTGQRLGRGPDRTEWGKRWVWGGDGPGGVPPRVVLVAGGGAGEAQGSWPRGLLTHTGRPSTCAAEDTAPYKQRFYRFLFD